MKLRQAKGQGFNSRFESFKVSEFQGFQGFKDELHTMNFETLKPLKL
jgi:hypothetical protein